MLAQSNDKEALRIKLEADRSLVLGVDKHGQLPLYRAINRFMPDIEIIKTLLQFGADPDYEDAYGCSPRRFLATAILCNVFRNGPEVAAGLEAFLPMERGIDALDLNYTHKLVCGISPIPLVSAPENLGPKMVREQIDEPSAEGLTALHLATMRRDAAAIKTLLHAGANVDAQDIWV